MTKTIWTMTIAMILVAGLVAPAFSNYAFAAGTYSINADELSGETAVNPIPIGTSAVDFYSYGSASANTGLEESNTVVMFLGEDDNGDVSLFVIYDAIGDVGAGRASTTITSTGLANEGVSFLVKDDPGELHIWNDATGSGSTLHRWAPCCTDGFVLGTLPATDFDIFPVFSRIFGIDNFVFLTQGDSTIETINVSNNAPTSMVISLESTSTITVDIDIKPGSDTNPVNTKSKGVIPVAVYSTADFDATTIDPSTVVFGPTGAAESHGKAHIEDVNGDGLDDVVLHFKTQDSGIVQGDTEASLTGSTFDGTAIEGSDVITTK